MLCLRLATPGTQACDAVGGAFRPEWREWPRSERGRGLSVLLDSLGESDYSPRLSRRAHLHGQTTRPSARHSGHANPQGRFARATTRLRHSAAHPADFERPAGDSTRLAIPGAVSPGTPRLDHE